MRPLVRSHIEAWVKAMQSADRGLGKPPGLAAGTIRTRFNNVRAALRGAVKDRIIASDPSEGVRLPRGRRSDVAMELPTALQVRALLDAADRDFRALVALCAFAGLRLGEAAAVQVGDVDLSGRTLLIRRQVQRERGGGVEIRSPKYGSERTVYLADGLVTIVKAHITRLSGAAPSAGCSTARTETRRIRTRSATGGARLARRRAARGSSCTTCGTTTRPA
jgi:integrase